MAIYKVHESNIEALTKKAHTIENKARKYGCKVTFSVDSTPIYEEVKDKDGEVHIQKYYNVTAEGEAKVNGWMFVGTIEHTPDGNIIRKAVNDITVPERYRYTKPVCEHCNTIRNRKDTYLLYNEELDMFKQVGKSCLLDFTQGMSVEMAAFMAQWEKELEESYGAASGWSNRGYIYTDDLLKGAVLTIEKFGYIPTNGFGLTSRDAALQLHNEAHGFMDILSKAQLQELHSSIPVINPKDGFPVHAEEVVKAAKAWLNEQDEHNNDYIFNIKLATKMEYTERRNAGLVVSMIQSYFKAVDRAKKYEAKRQAEAISNWVGAEGDKFETKVASAKVITSWGNDWGVTYMYKFVTAEGNILIWKSGVDVDTDTVESIKGTVKAHTEFNGIKQTELTRCKVAYK